MYFDVTSALHTGKYSIELHFEDGSSGTVDLGKYLEEGTMLGRLRDEAVFRRFAIEYGTLVWKDASVDIAPETLYAEATGKQVVYRQQSGVAP